MVEHEDGQRIAQEIDAARRRLFPKVSVRSAAAQAGISEGWWRQLVAGEQKRGDSSFPVIGSAETYLAMARAVGIEADIASMLGQEAPPSSTHAPPLSPMVIDAIHNDPDLLPEAKQHLLSQYALLRRLSPQPSPSVAPGRKSSRRTATASDQPGLRAVARGGDPAHREEVSRMARRVREQHDNGEGTEEGNE